jgi:YegS/Rv2252/BmrU family lipid kinase
MRTDELEQVIREARAAALVVNTCSQRGERLFVRARHELARRGITLTALARVQHPSLLPDIVDGMINDGHRLVIVGGGDGTISTVVDAFAFRDAVLGLLPFGTGNSFAQTLGVPLALPEAVDVIEHGRVVRVDLGRVGAHYFANTVEIGLSTEVARTTTEPLKRLVGNLAYLLVGAMTLWRHRPFRCTMVVDGSTQTYDTHEVIVANGRIFGRTVLHQEATVEDRLLTISVMEPLDRLRHAWLWLRFILGRPSAFARVPQITAQELVLAADPPQAVTMDGELIGATPMQIRVAPEALNVLVPAHAAG